MAIAAADLHATIRVHDLRFYRAVAFGGSIGAGESYRDGYWSCDDLVALIQIFARNMQASSDLGGFWNTLLDIGRKVAHRVNRNTRSGKSPQHRRALRPEQRFLLVVPGRNDDLLQRRFSSSRTARCRTRRLKSMIESVANCGSPPTDEVLEIGTGWGGFAEHAVRHYGCRVTTTTISKQQHDFAKQRFATHGIDDRVTLLLSDYRDLVGQYDKLVSIEMIEAVGHEYLDTFFAKCSSLLKPDGLFALQAITIPTNVTIAIESRSTLSSKYIFPGGCLPSLGAMTASVGRVTDLQLASSWKTLPNTTRERCSAGVSGFTPIWIRFAS